MPKFIAVTSHGLSKYLKKELEVLFSTRAEIINESKVMLSTDWDKAIRILRYGRGMARILLLLNEFKFKDRKSLQEQIESIELENYLDPKKSFAVRCSRHGEHDFRSPDIERWGGEAVINRILSKTGQRIKVDLENPDYVVRIYVMNEKAWVGLDLVGNFSLNNRWYRVKKHPAGLRSTIAFQLVLASKWDPRRKDEKKLLDPTTGSATIPIEAALWAINYPVNDYVKNNFSVNHWEFVPEKDKSILMEETTTINSGKEVAIGVEKVHKFYSYALKNIKAAKVRENIKLILGNAFNLDTIINFGEISAMVFNPPFGVRMGKKEYLEQLYDKLMRIANEYSIRKISFLTTKIGLAERMAEKNNVEIIDKTMFLYGNINAFLIEAKT